MLDRVCLKTFFSEEQRIYIFIITTLLKYSYENKSLYLLYPKNLIRVEAYKLSAKIFLEISSLENNSFKLEFVFVFSTFRWFHWDQLIKCNMVSAILMERIELLSLLIFEIWRVTKTKNFILFFGYLTIIWKFSFDF